MKGHGKQEEQTSLTSKTGPGKFVTSKVRVPQNSVSQVSAMPQSQAQQPPPASGPAAVAASATSAVSISAQQPASVTLPAVSTQNPPVSLNRVLTKHFSLFLTWPKPLECCVHGIGLTAVFFVVAVCVWTIVWHNLKH